MSNIQGGSHSIYEEACLRISARNEYMHKLKLGIKLQIKMTFQLRQMISKIALPEGL